MPNLRTYVIIKAKQTLQNVISVYPTAEFVARDCLWVFEEGSRSLETDESLIGKLKLMFVAMFRHNLSEYIGDEFREILAEMFSSSTLSVADFDNWWTIEPILFGYHIGEAVKMLSTDEIKSLEKTGLHQIDEWLDWTIDELK